MSTNAPNMPHWTEPAPADFQGIPKGDYPKLVIDAPKAGEVVAEHMQHDVAVQQQIDGSQRIDVNHQLPTETTQ